MGFLSNLFGLKTDKPKEISNTENNIRKSVQEQFNKRVTELRSNGKSDKEISEILEREIDTGFGLTKPKEEPSKISVDLNIDLDKIQNDLQSKINIRINQLKPTGISDLKIEQMIKREMDKGIGIFREEDTELWKWELDTQFDHLRKKNCKKCIKMSQYPPNTFSWWHDRGWDPAYGVTCKNCMCNLRPLTEDEMKEYLQSKKEIIHYVQ